MKAALRLMTLFGYLGGLLMIYTIVALIGMMLGEILL